MAKFDATAKHLIEGGPGDWLALAGLPVPKSRSAVRVVDADLSTVTTAPDKLLRVRGADGPYVAHIEFQSFRDPHLDGRVLMYNVMARKRHRLPVRSIVFLLRPAAATPSVTGGFREKLDRWARLEFDYRLIRVWELPAELLLTGGLGTLPLAPISAVNVGDLPTIVGRVRERLTSEAEPADAAELWTATGILMSMCYRRSAVAELLKGARTMRGSWLYQDILSEGRVEGRVEGLVEGRAEGRLEGRLEGERNLVLRLGTHKFGPASDAVRERLESITNFAELERLGLAVLEASSWDALLAPRRRRRGRH